MIIEDWGLVKARIISVLVEGKYCYADIRKCFDNSFFADRLDGATLEVFKGKRNYLLKMRLGSKCPKSILEKILTPIKGEVR